MQFTEQEACTWKNVLLHKRLSPILYKSLLLTPLVWRNIAITDKSWEVFQNKYLYKYSKRIIENFYMDQPGFFRRQVTKLTLHLCQKGMK